MRALLSVANVLGRLLMVFGVAYIMPIICALVYRDGTLPIFLASLAVCLVAGGSLALARQNGCFGALFRARKEKSTAQDGRSGHSEVRGIGSDVEHKLG